MNVFTLVSQVISWQHTARGSNTLSSDQKERLSCHYRRHECRDTLWMWRDRCLEEVGSSSEDNRDNKPLLRAWMMQGHSSMNC